MNTKILDKFKIPSEDAKELHNFKTKFGFEIQDNFNYTKMLPKDITSCHFKPCVLEGQTHVFVVVGLSVKTDTMIKCISLEDLFNTANTVRKYRFVEVYLVTPKDPVYDTDSAVELEPKKRGRPAKDKDIASDSAVEPKKRGRPAKICIGQEYMEYLYNSDGSWYLSQTEIMDITDDKKYKIMSVSNDTTTEKLLSHKQIKESIERSVFDQNNGYIVNIVGTLIGQLSMYKNDEYLVKLSQQKHITCVFPCYFDISNFSYTQLKIGDNLILNRNNLQQSIDELKLEAVCTNQVSQETVFAYHYHVPNDAMWVYECYFTCLSETELECLKEHEPIANLMHLFEEKVKKEKNIGDISVFQLKMLPEYEAKLLDYINIRVLAKQWGSV